MDLESLALRVRRNENLPVLPQVATTVLKLVEDPRSSARDMERAIEKDMALATKVLRVANSSYYGTTNVNSISRAVSVLGLNTVRSLVVSIAYQQMVSGKGQSTLFQRTDFWSHSLGVGITSRIIAKMLMPQKAEEMYLAGIMHDVGMLVLDRYVPSELDHAISLCKEENIPMHEAEERTFGFDHAQVGGILAEQWGLSKGISNAIRFHHCPHMDELTPQLTCMITIANTLAHQAGLQNHFTGTLELDEQCLSTVGLTAEQLEVIGVVMVQEVSKAQQAFRIDRAA